MLQRIASLVKPIMKKHGWIVQQNSFRTSVTHSKIHTLKVKKDENGEEKILLRLRPPYNADAFLEEEEAVQTMLHMRLHASQSNWCHSIVTPFELTHNVHCPHDDKFYKFLSGLQWMT
ncbi:hypothetical protein PQX77_019304 [Marasmius sp. AFHP31]|nr:hypothetical protein PQX77_019304 [Marasmius sp. AFHP31]